MYDSAVFAVLAESPPCMEDSQYDVCGQAEILTGNSMGLVPPLKSWPSQGGR